MYRAHAALLAAQDRALRRDSGLSLATNLMTFVLLWRTRQYSDAYRYAQICSNELARSRFALPLAGKRSRNYWNVVGLVLMALAACCVKVDNDVKRALETLEQAKSELEGRHLPAEVLVSAIIRDIQTVPKLETLTPAKGPLRALEYV